MSPKSTFACAICALMLSAAPVLAADPAMEERVKVARGAIMQLAEELKGELVGALQSGGPVKATETCSIVAPQISTNVSQGKGLTIGRTALKVRNPANVPDDFEKAQLEAFAARIAAGEDAMKIDHAEVVTDASGAKTFRYMKAIPMAEKPCAVCHGAELKPELKAEIDKLYPADQAVGFKVGELRGAFTVKQKVD